MHLLSTLLFVSLLVGAAHSLGHPSPLSRRPAHLSSDKTAKKQASAAPLLQRRQNCAAVIPLTLGTTVHSETTVDDACALYSLQLPAGFTQDISVHAGWDTTQSSSPQFSLVREADYEMDQFDDEEFEIRSDTPFHIPNCALYSTKYFIKASSFTTVNFNLTIQAVGSQPIRTLPGGTTVITGTATAGAWDYVQVPVPDPSKATHVKLVSLSNSVYAHVSDYGCPTEQEKRIQFSSFGGADDFFNTYYPNKPLYIGVEYTGFSAVNYTLVLEYGPVECGIISADTFEVCKNVDYETPLLSGDEAQSAEAFLGLFGAFFPGECGKVLTNLTCGSIFYKCDGNGFPMLPCAGDCEELVSTCGAYINSEDGDLEVDCNEDLFDTENERYCYVSSSSGPLVGSAVAFLAGLMLVLLA